VDSCITRLLMGIIDAPRRSLSYTELMSKDGAHIRMKLDTHEPVALNDFVGAFVGIGSQFEKFVSREDPSIKAESEFFVKEVRAGCIEADLVAWVAPAFGTLAGIGPVDLIDKGQILTQFVNTLGNRIGRYFARGGRDPSATKGDLSDFHKSVSAIARDPRAVGRIESAVFEDGERKIRSAFKFTAAQAETALQEIDQHRIELEARSEHNEARVLLRFVRPSIEAGKPGKKGGERGVIESVAKKALPILYASALAEERMRHEKMQLDGNVFRALFDVSVNIELSSSGRPLAYRITEVHAVLEDDEEDEPKMA